VIILKKKNNNKKKGVGRQDEDWFRFFSLILSCSILLMRYTVKLHHSCII